jgi:hypothetical protein
MKTNIAKLARQIVTEAAAADDQINVLVEKAIETALSEIEFEALKNNFEEAKKQYYNSIRKFFATQLGVEPTQVGSFITTDMNYKFSEALRKSYEALKSTPDEVDLKFSDPQILTES